MKSPNDFHMSREEWQIILSVVGHFEKIEEKKFLYRVFSSIINVVLQFVNN